MIKVKKFVFNTVMENTYVVSDTETKETAIIDCGCMFEEEQNKLKRYIEEEKLIPKLLLSTHLHFDHVWGNDFAMKTWNLIPKSSKEDAIGMPSPEEQTGGFMPGKIKNTPIDYIEPGDKLQLGKFEIEVLMVPGHTPGHLAFYIPQAKCLFAGDILFYEEIGRCDLWGGSFDNMIKYTRSELLTLPDNTTVYCGHGPETTIGHEKSNNPYYRSYYN